MFYTLPKGSLLGGKYGTKLTASFSAANSLDTTRFAPAPGCALFGFERNSWGFGDVLFVRDFNASIGKLNKKWKAKSAGYHFDFNTEVTPVTTDYKVVNANIHVIETQWKVKPKQSLAPSFKVFGWAKREKP